MIPLSKKCRRCRHVRDWAEYRHDGTQLCIHCERTRDMIAGWVKLMRGDMSYREFGRSIGVVGATVAGIEAGQKVTSGTMAKLMTRWRAMLHASELPDGSHAAEVVRYGQRLGAGGSAVWVRQLMGDLTVEEFADAIGYSRGVVYLWLKGERMSRNAVADLRTYAKKVHGDGEEDPGHRSAQAG